METAFQEFQTSVSSSDNENEKYALAVGGVALCFMLGYVVASGRWDLLKISGKRLLSHLGTIAADHAVQIIKEI